MIEKGDKTIQHLEKHFQAIERNLTYMIRLAEQDKDALIATIKEKQGLPPRRPAEERELSATNWEDRVADKTIFVKFFAPWCGHCQAMKQDWDKLMTAYEGTLGVLVAEADCIGKAKELCKDQDV